MMTLIDTTYLVYLPTPSFRKEMARFVSPDQYGSIYAVSQGQPISEIRPPRAKLDAAHWAMFLALLQDNAPELREIAIKHGFARCWQVYSLDIESGDYAIADARTLPAE
jgi:hypothetical protein